MPEENGSQDPPQSANDDHIDNNSTVKELEKIKVGERWLIGVGIITLLVNIYIAYVYTGQLTQMRIATETSTRAVDLTNETLQYNASQFDRAMQQTVEQTVSQYKGTQASIKAANAAQSAAKTARESLITVQRAFVFPDPEDQPLYAADGKTVRGVRVVIHWKNSGLTPTKNLTIHRNTLFIRSLPDNYRFQDIGDTKTRPLFISPQGAIGTNPQDIQTRQMTELAEGKMQLYLYGWARYNDVFEGTSEHITRYCYQFIVQPKQSLYNMISCDKNNCSDDVCRVK